MHSDRKTDASSLMGFNSKNQKVDYHNNQTIKLFNIENGFTENRRE